MFPQFWIKVTLTLIAAACTGLTFFRTITLRKSIISTIGITLLWLKEIYHLSTAPCTVGSNSLSGYITFFTINKIIRENPFTFHTSSSLQYPVSVV